MQDSTSPLRKLPRVDVILAHPQVATYLERISRPICRNAAREAVEEMRSKALSEDSQLRIDVHTAAARTAELLSELTTPSLRKIVNAAGVILHTGLGRAPLSSAAQEALADVSSGYVNIQTDLKSGRRMPRETHVLKLLQHITGARAALVVNNNAAATVLALNTLAVGREVLVSRGEMVEIGGAFRIPEIFKLSGCKLVEVGCTNRTHLRDYENAITPETALILSVHQSNYRIEGFTAQVETSELAALARARGLSCVHDLGSGALFDLEALGLPYEPTVPESLATGVDATLFSGDKLIGGPQCGIIVGAAGSLKAMSKNPFYRIFRVGKLTLAALEATLRTLLNPETAIERHRLMSVLTRPLDALQKDAESLAQRINEACSNWLCAETRDEESQIGAGSLTGRSLPTVVVQLQSGRISAAALARKLRLAQTPVFVRIHDDLVLLDPRTMFAGDNELVLQALAQIGDSLSLAGGNES